MEPEVHAPQSVAKPKPKPQPNNAPMQRSWFSRLIVTHLSCAFGQVFRLWWVLGQYHHTTPVKHNHDRVGKKNRALT